MILTITPLAVEIIVKRSILHACKTAFVIDIMPRNKIPSEITDKAGAAMEIASTDTFSATTISSLTNKKAIIPYASKETETQKSIDSYNWSPKNWRM